MRWAGDGRPLWMVGVREGGTGERSGDGGNATRPGGSGTTAMRAVERTNAKHPSHPATGSSCVIDPRIG